MPLATIKDTITANAGNILNVYFTAGYPQVNSTTEIILSLSESGVDLIELGLPYSDPLADGTTIQDSSQIALANGINLDLIFKQVEESRKSTSIPIIMMGYFNQLLQYDVERFLKRAKQSGVNGLIIPDLPMNIYERDYKTLFERYEVGMSFLITPQTSEDRIRQADRLSSAFIYVVSQTSITGKKGNIEKDQIDYFERINAMKLNSPQLIGFGIHDKETYDNACQYSDGAIIGSQFIRVLTQSKSNLDQGIQNYISSLR